MASNAATKAAPLATLSYAIAWEHENVEGDLAGIIAALGSLSARPEAPRSR